MKKSEIAFGIARIPIDFIMAVSAFLTAYRLRTFQDVIPGIELEIDILKFQPLNEYFKFSLIASAILVLLFAINKMYSLKTTHGIWKEIRRVFVLNSTLLMLIIFYFFVIREFPFSRLVLAYTWILSIVFVSFGRMLIKFLQRELLKMGIGQRRVLFVGNNAITQNLFEKLSKNPIYKCVGVIDNNLKKTVNRPNPLGKIDELEKIVRKFKIEEIIQTTSTLAHTRSHEILDFCREKHVGYSFVPDLLEVHSTNIEVNMQGEIPLISLKPTPLDGWGKVIKRTFDITASGIGLVVLSPILLIASIAIKLDSKGPILFSQLDDGSKVKRVGQYGNLFEFFKFRSMYPKTHNLRYTELAEQNQRKGSPLVKIKDDPRITKVGKFIRKTSLDELPQLWNVLKGNMSLVGPRPHFPEEVDKYQKHHRFVFAVKPGLTGLSQISGRSDLDFEKEVQLDTYYIEHWSLLLDLRIIFKTFFALIRGYKE